MKCTDDTILGGRAYTLEQGSLIPSVRHARNWAVEASEVPTAGFRQHMNPSLLQSAEKPLSTEPFPGAKRLGGGTALEDKMILMERRMSRQNKLYRHI